VVPTLRTGIQPQRTSTAQMSVPHGLWDALKQSYEDAVEDDIYVQEVQDDPSPVGEEDWEKGIPPFVKKLTKMVGENKSILSSMYN
jgi:hypothetical protein